MCTCFCVIMAQDFDKPGFDAVKYLLETNLSSLTLKNKIYLTTKISRPKISLFSKDGKSIRKFQHSWYSKYEWLCGTVQGKSEKLLCFYCLLFGGDEPWSRTGINVIKNFESKAKKHDASQAHIKCAKAFCKLQGRSYDEVRKSFTLVYSKSNKQGAS